MFLVQMMNSFSGWAGRCRRNIFVALIPLFVVSCSATDLPTVSADLGRQVSIDAVFSEIAVPGPIDFKKVTSATWAVPLSGLLNLEHPKAQAAGIEDREELISIYTYVLKHPEYGVFLIDAGVSESFRSAENDDVSWLVNKAMNIEALTVRQSNQELLESLGGQAISGVLLTHIHLDHIMGFDDLPNDTDVYLGPGDAKYTAVDHLATRGTTNRLLKNVGQLKEWGFGDSKALDVFGDGSLFALHAPGHTVGLTVYVARTTDGAQLMMGDLTHTRWGWENGVEPGSYSADVPESAKSLAWVKSLVADYDATGDLITVHPGHQSLADATPGR